MKKLIAFLLLSLVGLILLVNSMFVVDEMHTALVLQFGRHVRTLNTAGLKWKTPFIQDVLLFEKRIQAWDGQQNQIPTLDKKFIWIDTTARWRIKDPLQFYKAVHDNIGAQKKLDDIIDGITREIISNKLLIEIVRTSNREMVYSKEFASDEEEANSSEAIEILTGRKKITRTIYERSVKDAESLGIEIVDVLIKRINYTEDVREQVYKRMITERNKVAERYRAEGKKEKSKILGLIDEETKRIRSESFRQAEEIRGQADAEATRIYAESYSQDPEFYAFVKALESYHKSIDKETLLVVTTRNGYLKFLKNVEESKSPAREEATDKGE